MWFVFLLLATSSVALSAGLDPTDTTTKKIPLALALKFNSITSTTQLFREFVRDSPQNSSARLEVADVERKAAIVPEPAGCMPERRTVPLKNDHDLSELYFPSCTRIERCGGCCSQDELLSCQPTEIEIINYQVHVMNYIGGTKLTYKGKEVVRMEKHVRCKCDCIVKPEDCNMLQLYVKGKCQCVCTNTDEQSKCLDSKIKFWDSNTCTCECVKKRDCSTGFTFNKHTCSCESEQRPRIRFGEVYSTNTRVNPYKREEYSLVTDNWRKT